MPTETLEIRAHAKLNLALAVAPPVAEGESRGMHPIASWVCAIDLHDRITLTRKRTGSETACRIRWADGSPVDWPIESDLAYRAHKVLERIAGPMPVSISIVKSIPAGGGLGGGSSDAASVLRGLVQMFDLDMPGPELMNVAGSIGSDVPFFIDEVAEPNKPPRAAIVQGLGDRIERTGTPRFDPGFACLLVCPPFGCPTGEVYRAFDDHPDPPDFRKDEISILAKAYRIDPDRLFNDLTTPAEAVRPRMRTIRIALEDRLGLPVHMSGSGSALFCFVPDHLLEDAVLDVRKIEPGAIVIPVKPT